METDKSVSESNPFSTRFWTAGALPFRFCNENSIELLCQKLSLRKVQQIVGAHGSGKSALAAQLHRYLQQKGFEVIHAVLNTDERCLPREFAAPKQDASLFYVLDGYEQLSLRERLQLRCQRWSETGGLLWTAHRPAWGVPVLYRTAASFDVFFDLVQTLTQDTAFRFDESFLRDLLVRCNGNFRTAFFELYDQVQ